MMRMKEEARANTEKIDRVEQENQLIDIEISRLQSVTQPPPPSKRSLPPPLPSRNSAPLQQTPTPSFTISTPILPKIKIKPPQPFNGTDPSQYLRFLRSCQFLFAADPSSYASDNNKVITSILYLKGSAEKYV
jgi:hypothetical protein